MNPGAILLLLGCLTLLAACGPGSNFNPPPNSNSTSTEASPDVKAFRNDAVALQRRPELDLDEVTIQYVLIASGVEGLNEAKPDLTLPEAEALAADVYKHAKAGSDFDKLVLTHSYGRLVSGQQPGMVTLKRGLSPEIELVWGPNTFRREQEEVAVWHAAWRLAPGDVGPVERHETDANTGYYIVRRLTQAEVNADNPANAEPTNDAVRTMREEARALLARFEHGAKRVKVQHLLIGRYFSGQAAAKKRLMPVEAEELTANVWTKVKAGDDFDALVREHTYDQAPGEFVMVADRSDETLTDSLREGMIPAFGDAAWRLEVGEFGVILYDRARCFYGYHIIKRLE